MLMQILRTKLKFLIGVLTVAGAAGGMLVSRAVAETGPVADADPAAWVARRVQEIEPTRAERRFDEIGWVTGIREAERLAREHGRPVFLFTHDGRMAVGRC